MSLRKAPGLQYHDLRTWGVPGLLALGRLNWSTAHPPLPRHAHPGTIEIIYLHRGRQTYWVAGGEFHLRGGEVFVTRPGERHGSEGRPQERSIVYWFQLAADLPLDAPFLACVPGEGRELSAALVALPRRHFAGETAFAEQLERCCAARLAQGPLARSLVALELTRVCLRLVELARAGGGQAVSPAIDGSLRWIAGHLASPLPCAVLARRCGLSPSHFKARFAAEVGCPPQEYVTRERLTAAKRRLADGASVTSTALELGFPSPQHFATVFRRYTGLSPSRWRP